MGRSGEHVNFGVIKSHPNAKYLHYKFASGDFEENFCIPSFPPNITNGMFLRMDYFNFLDFYKILSGLEPISFNTSLFTQALGLYIIKPLNSLSLQLNG